MRGLARAGIVTAALLRSPPASREVVGVDSWIGLVLVTVISGPLLLAVAVVGGLSSTQRVWLWNRAGAW